MLNQERVTQLKTDGGISNRSAARLMHVKEIYQKAFTSYHYIFTSNDWFMQGNEKSCWEYGGDHGLI